MKLETKFDQIQKAICPLCNGDKKVSLYRGFLGHTTGHVHEDEVCDLCKGEGIVRKYTIYKPISSTPVEHEDYLSRLNV
jgi:hypothetical protein